MPNLNKIMLIGHLTRDPQLSYLPSQTSKVEFGLAISHKYKKQDGTRGEETCFVECQMFGKRAEVINKHVQKGDPLFVEGRLKLDTWNAQDGTKRNKHSVFVENFEFLGKSGKPKQEHKPKGDTPSDGYPEPDYSDEYGDNPFA